MGSSMSGVVGGLSATSTSSTAIWQQRNQDLQSLSKALQSGNLDQAKAAYAQLVKDSPAGATQDPNSPLSQIGKALQGNDIAGAQKAMSALKTHHGGGHHRIPASSTTTSTATTATPIVSNPTDTLGNSVNILA